MRFRPVVRHTVRHKKSPSHINQLRRRAVDGIPAAMCLMIFACELVVSYRNLTVIDGIFAVLYAMLLLCSAVQPRPYCIMLALLCVAESLVPCEINGPTMLWGVWLSLVRLAYSINMTLAITLGGLCTLTTLISPLLEQSAPGTGTISLAATYMVAVGGGAAARWRQRITTLQSEAEVTQERIRQQQERLRIAHTLHDSTAGSLSYAIRLCQTGMDKSSSDARQYVHACHRSWKMPCTSCALKCSIHCAILRNICLPKLTYMLKPNQPLPQRIRFLSRMLIPCLP